MLGPVEHCTIGDCLWGGGETLEPSISDVVLCEATPTTKGNIINNGLNYVLIF